MLRWCSKIKDPPKLPQKISAILHAKCYFAHMDITDITGWGRLGITGEAPGARSHCLQCHYEFLWPRQAGIAPLWCRFKMRYQLSSHRIDGFSIHWYHLWQSQPWIHHPGWLKSDFEAKNSSLAHWVIHWNSLGIHSDSQGFSCTPTVEQLGRGPPVFACLEVFQFFQWICTHSYSMLQL